MDGTQAGELKNHFSQEKKRSLNLTDPDPSYLDTISTATPRAER